LSGALPLLSRLRPQAGGRARGQKRGEEEARAGDRTTHPLA
jgi:hypothetical protein